LMLLFYSSVLHFCLSMPHNVMHSRLSLDLMNDLNQDVSNDMVGLAK